MCGTFKEAGGSGPWPERWPASGAAGRRTVGARGRRDGDQVVAVTVDRARRTKSPTATLMRAHLALGLGGCPDEDGWDGQEQDFHVQAEGLAPHVLDVQSKHLLDAE